MITSEGELDTRQIAVDFERDGFVKLTGIISPEELRALQGDTQIIIDGGHEDVEHQMDFRVSKDSETGEGVFSRVQFIFPLATTIPNPMVALLGHPTILAVVIALLGDDFLCNAEALVFKNPGNGPEVRVHADCDPADPRISPEHIGFNVDFYLDDATQENGWLLVAPGSHMLRYSQQEIMAKGFDFPGLRPVPMKAGDILIHNIRLVHGSHKSNSDRLRRTIYYEFQSLAWMIDEGIRPELPANDEWSKARIRLMLHAIETRKACSYAASEVPFDYTVPTGFEVEPNSTANPVELRTQMTSTKNW